MLQVHVVTAANQAMYGDQMDACFRWRRICSEEKRSSTPRSDERDVDPYDTDDATYLLAFLEGALVAGSRLRPFSTPTLLADVFPQLVVRDMPTDRASAEWTRMFVVPAARKPGCQGVAAAMCCAVLEYCLAAGIARLGGVHEAYWLPQWGMLGWRVHPLGLPQDVGGKPCIAALLEVSPAQWERTRRAAGIRDSQIIQRGPCRDFMTGTVYPGLPEPPPQTQIDRMPKVLS